MIGISPRPAFSFGGSKAITFFTPASGVVSDDITVLNANLTGGSKPFPGTSGNTLTASGLYPFLDGVAVYAGTCDANNPASYTGQSNYFSTSGRGFKP